MDNDTDDEDNEDDTNKFIQLDYDLNGSNNKPKKDLGLWLIPLIGGPSVIYPQVFVFFST